MMHRKTLGVIGALLVCVLATGCSSSTDASAPTWAEGASAQQLAESSSDYIKEILADGGMDQSQVAMLERALGNDGQVAYADYATAWSNYRQCLVDKGYTAPPLTQVNGLYLSQSMRSNEGLDALQEQKIDQDWSDCMDRYVSGVNDVYRDNVANPNLYVELDVAMVDCMRRGSLVPDSYTVRDYQREYEDFLGTDNEATPTWEERRTAFTFDLSDQNVLNCAVATDSSLLSDRLEEWKPFG